MSAQSDNYPYSNEQLHQFSELNPASPLTALTDDELAGLARHIMPDMAQEILQLRAKLAETTTHTKTAPILPAQLSAGGQTPPPITCLR